VKEVVVTPGTDSLVFDALKASYELIGRDIEVRGFVRLFFRFFNCWTSSNVAFFIQFLISEEHDIIFPLFSLLKRDAVPALQSYLARVWGQAKALASNDENSEHV
jgi:hypothetical protein